MSTTTTLNTGTTSYYAVYRANVTIYYPKTATTRDSYAYFRNAYYGTGTNYTGVIATSNTGTSNFTFTSSVSGYSLYGFGTSASSNTIISGVTTVAKLATDTNTTVYAILRKSVSATIYYNSNSTSGSFTAANTSVSAYQYIRCTSSAAETSNSNYTIPDAVKNSVGQYSAEYVGLATGKNSMSASTSRGTANTKLYAVYRSAVTIYTPTSSSAVGTKTAYRNEYLTADDGSTIATKLSTTNTGTSDATSANIGIFGTLKGFATSVNTSTVSTNPDLSTLAKLRDSNQTTVYAIVTNSRNITFKSGDPANVTNNTVAQTITYYCKATNTIATSNGTITTPTPVSVDKWTTLGWRDDTTAGNKEFNSSASITPTVTTYYAAYSRTLTITYNGNGSDGGSTANTTKTVYLNTNSTTTSNQAVTLATNGFTRTGYRFVEWNTQANGNGTSYAEGASYTAGVAYNASTFGKTIYAKWKANTITLTLKVDNGAYSNSGIKVDLYQSGKSKASTTVSSGNTATFTAVANGTYDVYAGNHSGAKTTLIDTGLDITVNNNDKTGTINYYSLKLLKGTGISGTNQTGFTGNTGRYYLYKSSGTQQDISIDATVSSGYTWVTWTKTAGTNLATFTPGTKSQNVKMGAGAATLTASAVQTPQITLSDFNTFTYTAEGAVAYYVSTSNTVPTAGTTNASSTFALDTWTTATSTGNLSLSSGQTYYVWAESAVTGGVISASSSIAVRTVTRSQGTGSTLTIKYTNSSGSNVTFSSNKANMLNGTVLYVSAVVKTGYKNPVLKKDGTNATNSTTYTIDANVTFASSATEKTATLTYNANGHGTAPANVTMKYTKATNAADALTLDGYEFQGWNTAADGTGTAYEPGAQVKAANVVPTETTLYAQWRKIRVMFKPGTEVKATMRSLANYEDSTLQNFKRATALTTQYTKKVVSTSDSEVPIYMWFDNNTIYYYSEASHPQLNPDSQSMFSGIPFINIELETIDTSEAIDMNSMFAFCRKLTNVDFSNFDTSNVTNMGAMFAGIIRPISLDLSSFDTSNVTNMDGMFNGSYGITSINLSSFNTSKVTDMHNMFRYCCGLTSLDLSNFDTSNVTNMSEMFNMNEPLEHETMLASLNISNFNTSKVTNMSKMFCSCSNLTSLNVSNFNTSKVTDMSYMFDGCSSITSLDVSNFNTSKVTDMSNMFNGCELVTSLNVSNFNTSNVTTMRMMFRNCMDITSLNLSNFDTSKVTDMGRMFEACRDLNGLNISNFDTLNVTKMDNMFSVCDSLTSLDLSSFDTLKVTDMSTMFYNCGNLVTIYVSNSWTTSAVTESTRIFYHDYNLVGGAGTTYSVDSIGYAKIDGGTSNPGYFTYKAASTTNLVNPTSLNNVRLTNNTSSLTSTYGSELGRQLKIKND